jgi:hypothetical protein
VIPILGFVDSSVISSTSDVWTYKEIENFFSVLGLNLRAFTLSHSASSFWDGYFRDRVSRTICPGWLQTMILLTSASWVARIIGMTHSLALSLRKKIFWTIVSLKILLLFMTAFFPSQLWDFRSKIEI